MNDLDLIARTLRREEPHLADHGFTAAVMAQLPEKAGLPFWAENLIVLAATLLGTAAAASQFPLEKFFGILASTSLDFVFPTVSVGTLATVLAVAAAFVYALSGGVLIAARRNIL